MEITNVTFATPFEDSEPFWELRVEVEGSGILQRAAPVVAQVGEVDVESIVLNLDASGFVGLLREVPPAGAELKVGYADARLAGTGFTYEPPIA